MPWPGADRVAASRRNSDKAGALLLPGLHAAADFLYGALRGLIGAGSSEFFGDHVLAERRLVREFQRNAQHEHACPRLHVRGRMLVFERRTQCSVNISMRVPSKA